MVYKISFKWPKDLTDTLKNEISYYLEERIQAKVNSSKCTATFNTESPEEVGAIFLEIEDVLSETIKYTITPE